MGEYRLVGKVKDFIETEMQDFDLDEDDSVVVVLNNGRFFAFQNRCTHKGIPLSIGFVTEDDEVTCLLHGATYDMATGEAVHGLTYHYNIEAYKVRIEGDEVYVEHD